MNSEKKRKTADLLTICIKAGKTVKGFDSSMDAVKEGKAFCVLTASDASPKTVKEVDFVCGKYEVTVLATELEKAEMARLCGKETAVIAVCDKGFADGFIKKIQK
ncbi:MAG: ribosomal L7Ae/L30e/S12e/Gadd45 family protein [Ruminococcus sp.]|jgi:ribosomal protein L7Ae-like RNA K-turn-binding protein|nr:ribosomal L7Ae/L30e/S12e/Gadd45 family protein [Ruminococcus sp.]